MVGQNASQINILEDSKLNKRAKAKPLNDSETYILECNEIDTRGVLDSLQLEQPTRINGCVAVASPNLRCASCSALRWRLREFSALLPSLHL
jgi:hypothetical protein